MADEMLNTTPIDSSEKRRYPFLKLELPTRATAERDLKAFHDKYAGQPTPPWEEFKAVVESYHTTLSGIDDMTGLYNKKGYEQLSKKILQYVIDNDIPLVMLAMDGKKFKEINDEYGHVVGDVVLQGIANGIREATRDTDLLGRVPPDAAEQPIEESTKQDTMEARFGGDELVALLYGMDLVQVWVVTARMQTSIPRAVREAVEKYKKDHNKDFVFDKDVMVDIGAALFNKARHIKKDANGQDIIDIKPLFNDADAALYAAKNGLKELLNELDKEIAAEQTRLLEASNVAMIDNPPSAETLAKLKEQENKLSVLLNKRQRYLLHPFIGQFDNDREEADVLNIAA